MKQTIYEEIQRMTLLSKYDNSKTLSEQAKTYAPELEIAKAIHTAVSKFGGTDERGLNDAVKKITNPTQLNAVNDALISTWGGKGLEQVINGALGIGDGQNAKNIVDHLKTIGITATYTPEGDRSMKANSFVISKTPAVTADDSKIVAATDPWAKYPCVVNHPNATKTTDVKGGIVYSINGVYYYGNGRKRLTDGTMGNYTCNDPEFKTKVKKAAKPVPIPTELKDEEGIKKFQDWLDVNAKGWATGYQEGIINKGQNGGGYGKYGPRTQKAWVTYKDKYLTPVEEKPAAVTTTATQQPSAQQPSAQQINVPKYGPSYVGQDGVTYEWNDGQSQYVISQQQ